MKSTITVPKQLGATYLEIKNLKEKAVKRKELVVSFCKNMKFTNMASIRKILEIFVDTHVGERLNYNQFIKFIRVDDCMESRDLYHSCCIITNTKKGTSHVESRIMILYFLTYAEDGTKEQKLKFAFDLYDEEDSRILTIEDLKKILIAFTYSSSVFEVEKKAAIILQARTDP